MGGSLLPGKDEKWWLEAIGTVVALRPRLGGPSGCPAGWFLGDGFPCLLVHGWSLGDGFPSPFVQIPLVLWTTVDLVCWQPVKLI